MIRDRDDVPVFFYVGGEGHADSTDRMLENAIDEEGGIHHEFAHPRHIRSLGDGPVQDVGLSDGFQKRVKIDTVRDQTGFVRVLTETITRRVVMSVSSRLPVPQDETVAHVDLERGCLLLEHVKLGLF